MKKNLLLLLAVCLSALGLTAQAAPAVIHGSMIYDNGWGSIANPPYGIYSLPIEEGASLSQVKLGKEYNANGGGVMVDGKYYMVGYETSTEGAVMDITYRVFDAENNWALVRSVPQESITSIPTDLTYDPTTDRIYGCFYTEEGSFEFGYLNRLTGKPTILAPLGEQLVALAANRDGEMYAIGISGAVYNLAVEGKEVYMDYIGETELTIRFAQSATFDQNTNKLYWAVCMYDTSKENGIYEVNTSTGAVTKIVNLGDKDLTGLYIQDSFAKDKAPAAVESLAINFPQGKLKGSFDFKLPTKATDGTTLSGTLTYHILIDEVTTLTGTGTPGQTISHAHTFANRANHVISVSASNTTGRSPIEVKYAYIGRDTPAPLNVVMKETTSGLSVSWTAPTIGVNGGYIPTTELTYKVTRQPENVSVYTGTSTSFSEVINITEMNMYWYDVTAYLGTQIGETVSSNQLKLGDACSIPYQVDFSRQEHYSLFTIIDANNDKYIWNHGFEALVYEYNTDKGANDWAITPPLRLDPEYVYQFSFKTFINIEGYTEKLRVAFGTQPSVEAMTTEIVPEFSITWTNKQTTTAIVRPQSSDFGYIGFHATSDADNYYLFIDDIEVEQLASVHAPDSVTNFMVEPGHQGAMSAKISWNFPAKTLDGKALNKIDKIEIYRGNNLVTSLPGLTPGMAFNYTDTEAVAGFNTYSIVTYNEYGAGLKSERTVFVGEDFPASVTNIQAVDMGNGNVKLTWEAPTVGQNGGYINVEKLTYRITNVDGKYGLTTEVTGVTSYDDNVELKNDEQELAWYQITTISTKGESETVNSPTIFVGDPYTLPYKESFARMNAERGPWSMTTDGLSRWSTASYGSADPQDNDGGEIMFLPEGKGSKGWMISPKLSIEGTINPTLTFWVWHNHHSHNKLSVVLRTKAGKDYTLAEIDQTQIENAEKGWVKHTIELNNYLNNIGTGYFHIIFIAQNVEFETASVNTLFLDNILLRSYHEHDLQAGELTANTSSVTVGEPIEFKVPVINVGLNTATDYQVELYRDDKLVSSIAGKELAVNDTIEYTFSHIPNHDAAEVSKFVVKVNYAADQKLDNNESNSVEVNVLPGLPFIETLTGVENDNNSLTLYWEHPLMATTQATTADETVTEDFESYTAFTIKAMGQWTLYDGDKLATGGIINYNTGDYYQYENVEAPMAYQIFNASEVGLTGMWSARSGNQVLATFLNARRQAKDDWIISPQVDGAQVITFWAKAPGCRDFDTAETIEVLYSTTTTDISAFTRIGNAINISTEAWKEFSIELPEGTKYFAIRCTSNDQYVLYIDDITYRPAQNKLTVQGYNIYRNGEKINETLVDAETTYYQVTSITDGEVYQVTAVYNQGESILSNPYIIGGASVEDIERQAAQVIGTQGHIIIRNAQSLPVAIYTMSGELRYIGEGDVTIALARGFYIVRISNQVVKVIVR